MDFEMAHQWVHILIQLSTGRHNMTLLRHPHFPYNRPVNKIYVPSLVH